MVMDMKNIESELQEYIFNYCNEKNMSIDLRFACFGDENKFYMNNKEFSVSCVGYYTEDIRDIKQFFIRYLDHMWEDCKYPINRTALYIKDIVNMDSWYEVIVGGCLFVDDALT